jgi:uncharacterized membrane protein
MNWLLFWLFLHILAAVIAFGPLFVFPIVGTLAAQSPQNMRFALELDHRISTRLVIPLGLTMLISGSGLIWTTDINFFRTTYLIVAVALYFVALIISLMVLVPTTKQLLHIAEHTPAAPIGGDSLPPQVQELVRRTQMFGGLEMVLFLAIIFLMIIQPGGIAIR